MTLADFFAKARKNTGMSQRTLARNLNVHHSYISQIEAGNKPLPERLALDMCALFGISPGTLGDEGCQFEAQLVTDPQEVLLVRMFRHASERDKQTLIRTAEAFAGGHSAKFHKPNRD